MFIKFFQRINIVEPVVISLFNENKRSFVDVDMLGYRSCVNICKLYIVYSTTKDAVLINAIVLKSSYIKIVLTHLRAKLLQGTIDRSREERTLLGKPLNPRVKECKRQ